MQKTFIPQLIRMIRHLCVYITKHQATMNPYLSAQQQAALQSVVSACQAFYGDVITEQP
jgi:hypothetical protein